MPRSQRARYASGMKTAVSVPDEVFKQAEALAKRMKLNRSQLFSRALAEFVARHDPEAVTEAMNRVVDSLGEERDPFTARATQLTFERDSETITGASGQAAVELLRGSATSGMTTDEILAMTRSN